MRGKLVIEGISKYYGQIVALEDVSLSVELGDFTCLLGPSGCGKTTLLRLIAGFERPSRGRILLDGRDITDLPPQKRGLGMVFQSLALFPHMTVADNVAYGLKRKGMARRVREQRVHELLAMTQLTGMGKRPVTALSGGQRQRVAIARALAMEPQLFLLDEPLSALDARLRDQMQIELRELQKALRITTLFVTHDQAEAMILADTLAVFADGQLQQFGKAEDVYRNPATAFVADFLGAANIVEAEVVQDGAVEAAGAIFPARAKQPIGSKVRISLRAEDLALEYRGNCDIAISGQLQLVRDLGSHREILVSCPPREMLRCRTGLPLSVLGKPGSAVTLHIDPHLVSVFGTTGRPCEDPPGGTMQGQ